jgi:hypothetical protein
MEREPAREIKTSVPIWLEQRYSARKRLLPQPTAVFPNTCGLSQKLKEPIDIVDCLLTNQ